MSRIKKTEHTGAKNGGGFWGTRDEAKSLSKKLRRANGKSIIRKSTVTGKMKAPRVNLVGT
jgi:hypothetical protein